MPSARRVASAIHASLFGRSAPESRLLEPPAAHHTLSSLSLEPDTSQHALDTGVFDIELSRHGSRNGSRGSSRQPSYSGSHNLGFRRPGQVDSLASYQAAVPSFLTRKILDWSWPQGLAETQLLQDVTRLKPMSRGLDGFEVALLADELKACGWHVEVCCQGHRCAQSQHARRPTEPCLDDLHHQYIVCRQSPDGEAMDSIIEPRFKEIFQIGPATALFAGLMESVPPYFVGNPTQLALLAELLSAESVKAFQEGGWTIPPWRRVPSMLAKWGLAVPSQQARDRSNMRSAFIGSPVPKQCALPPLPFEPSFAVISHHCTPDQVLGLGNDSHHSLNDSQHMVHMSAAAPEPSSNAEQQPQHSSANVQDGKAEQPKQQAPTGAFARMLLSGGLWGLQPEQPKPSAASGIPQPPPNISREASEPYGQRTTHQDGRRSRSSQQVDGRHRSSQQHSGHGKPETESRRPSSSTSHPKPPAKQPAKISLLAQGLANAPQPPQQQQPFNPFESWAHLLPPVTTVKPMGPASQPKAGRRWPR